MSDLDDPADTTPAWDPEAELARLLEALAAEILSCASRLVAASEAEIAAVEARLRRIAAAADLATFLPTAHASLGRPHPAPAGLTYKH
jgi:hypothetical protein